MVRDRLAARSHRHSPRLAEWRSGDYYGPDVNRGARLTAVAHGGQIVVSEAAATTVSEQLPTEYALRDLGLHRLRDLADSERVFQVVAPGLVSEFPTLRSSNPQRGNLPFLLSSLVGRDAQVAEDVEILRDKRLVTLTGAAGIGKTHVALRVAAEVAPGLPDGAWLCELAEAQDAGKRGGAPRGDAQNPTGADRRGPGAGDLRLPPGEADLAHSRRLRRVVEPTGRFWRLFSADVRTCESSSRAARRLESQANRTPAPAAPASRSACPPARRRCERGGQAVRRSGTGRAPELHDRWHEPATVADLCRRVGGIPLAIELAAAKVVAMTPGEVLDALDEPFGLLNGTGVPGLGHHRQTLAGAIDWSYALLDDTERSIFNRLGVFSSTFDMVAAREVVNGEASMWPPFPTS